MSTFGERLRSLRNERKLHQSQFADIFGLSSSAIGSYERNEREPAYRQLIEFANYYNVSLDYLLGRTDERLTVEDYAKQTAHDLDEILTRYDIKVRGYNLSQNDKQVLSDVSVGLFWKHFTKE